MEDIEYFSIKANKDDSWKANIIRENIIKNIINNKIPESYYENNKWVNMKNNIYQYIENYIDKDYKNVVCIKKAGRAFNYDFDFIKDDKVTKVEFKFNAKKVENVPQFLQLGNTNRFLTNIYEKFYYDNYLINFCNKWDIELINEDIYLKNVVYSKSKNKFFNILKKNYNTNDLFRKEITNLSRLSIIEFVKSNTLNINTLEEHLFTSQQNKVYMLYYLNKFHYQQFDNTLFRINNIIKDKNKYICNLKNTNYKLNIMLRWKNTLGILNPALQISLKS